MESKSIHARVSLFTAMGIFGTIGIFTHYIPLPSSVIALVRALVGTLFLGVGMLLRGRLPDFTAAKRDLKPLLASGFFLGFNWILLFEAYKYTTVASATLCYYMAPVLTVIASAVFWREKLTMKRICCGIAAFAGMIFVSGVLTAGAAGTGFTGILLGLAAAVFYAGVVLCNKCMKALSGTDRTFWQLAVAGGMLLVYTLFTVDFPSLQWDGPTVLLMAFVGIVHTGIAYTLYFSAMPYLPTFTVAIGSYLDPILAVLLSALLLREPMGFGGILGAVLILGSAIVGEVDFGSVKKK